MKWSNLFGPDVNMSPADMKEFIADLTPEEYQLVDVRQPKEYEQEHIPGAMLIPVKELPDRLDELDSTKPTFVY